MILLAVSAWNVGAADNLESLDDEFLTYLAEFEGDEDDWTIVEPAVRPKSPIPPAKPASTLTKPPVQTKPEPRPTPPADTGSKP